MDIEHYISCLRAYPVFDHQPDVNGVRFEYADPGDEHLMTLRSEYGIDKVVTGDSTLKKALQSMAWVFSQFRHTGEEVRVPVYNALEILKRATEGRFYCFHKAVVLNEVLLSLGLRSRVVTCYPLQFDMDCHVAVLVFVPEQRKWVFIDPTFNTYFPDSRSGLLGPLEIRNAYLRREVPDFADIPIDKSWTLVLAGKEYPTYKDWYRMYMAKNCFRFSSPISCCFGSYGSNVSRTVYLNPLGYDATNEYDGDETALRFNSYTNSAADFLREPVWRT